MIDDTAGFMAEVADCRVEADDDFGDGGEGAGRHDVGQQAHAGGDGRAKLREQHRAPERRTPSSAAPSGPCAICRWAARRARGRLRRTRHEGQLALFDGDQVLVRSEVPRAVDERR
jgi:hypothetical protein